MTKKIVFECNLCNEDIVLGYGIRFEEKQPILSNDTFDSKNYDKHLCLNCANGIEKQLENSKFDRSINFNEIKP